MGDQDYTLAGEKTVQLPVKDWEETNLSKCPSNVVIVPGSPTSSGSLFH